jgi:ribosomal protein S18 acetylase RimI-like enzyme
MNYRIQENCKSIDWQNVSDILRNVGMGYYEPKLHKKAFENSYTVVFVFSEDKMIGFGRAISDGAYQAAIYDIAVLPEYQNQGIGKIIMSQIMKKISSCNTILYASPGKEEFYKKIGFSFMKTGMAMFLDPEKMKTKGMI